MQKCKQCEWEFPDDIRICPYCGHPVEPEDQKQKRRFKLRRHPGTLPEGAKGRPSGLVSSTARILTIALISAIVLASLIVGLVLIPFLGGHPQTPPPILILSGNIIPGGNISVQGHNFSPGGTVTFTIDGHTATIASGSSTAQHLPGTVSLALMSLSLPQLAPQMTKAPSGGTSVPVKSDGTFEATIQVDPHWPVGSSHLLVATEQSRGQQAHVTVNVPRQAELVSCSHSTATTDIALGPVLADLKQPVSTVFTLCTIGSGMVQWTASWGQRQAKWLQVDRTGQIQAPLSKQITISASACLNTSAASLSFTATQGQANPSPQSVKLSNCGNPGSWSATASTTDGGNWLNINPVTGNLAANATQEVSITVSSANLQMGTYTGLVTFKMGSNMAQVSVALTVIPPLSVQRQIPSTQTQSQTVDATGSGQTDATNATGTLTFTNTFKKEFTYDAHSTFVSKSRVQVAIDEDAIVPAADSNGVSSVTTVRAHAVEPGAAGNIAAGDVDNSLAGSSKQVISIKNDEAFTVGQDVQTYTFVQQSDIDGSATSLKNTTQQSAIDDIHQQLQPNEHLVGDPQCTSNVSSDHNTGDRVSQVTVTVTTTSKATAST